METPQITSFKQIKEIIEPIPAELFTTHMYADDKGCSCFLGHIHKKISGHQYGDFEGFGARRLTRKFLEEVHNVNKDGALVNNLPTVNGYTQPVVKDRVMAMIEDGIKWEEATKGFLNFFVILRFVFIASLLT